MRRFERLAIFGGIVLAIIIAMGARAGSGAAIAGTPALQQADPQGVRLGTVDIYTVIEKMMGRPDLKQAREDIASKWQAKAEAAEHDLQTFESTLRALPKDSPNFDATLKRAQERQADYQKLGEQRQEELEKVNSAQLVDAYSQVQRATETVAKRLGYTHILATRSLTQPIDAVTISATLQQLLARPLIYGNPQDDITPQVMAELKLDATPAAPGTTPATPDAKADH